MSWAEREPDRIEAAWNQERDARLRAEEQVRLLTAELDQARARLAAVERLAMSEVWPHRDQILEILHPEGQLAAEYTTMPGHAAPAEGWAADHTPEPPEWLVWSNAENAWWRRDGNGYTRELLQAGRFSTAAAEKACNTRSWEGELPPEVMILAPDLAAIEAAEKLKNRIAERLADATNARMKARAEADVDPGYCTQCGAHLAGEHYDSCPTVDPAITQPRSGEVRTDG